MSNHVDIKILNYINNQVIFNLQISERFYNCLPFCCDEDNFSKGLDDIICITPNKNISFRFSARITTPQKTDMSEFLLIYKSIKKVNNVVEQLLR